MKKLFYIFLSLILSMHTLAQEFRINTDLRMRYEHRNGYGQPKPDSLKAADFVVQRTRINFKYKTDKLELLVSPQNVRVWGDAPSATKTDINGIQIYQAWLKYTIVPKWIIKAGRQELNYDDARILGNVDWAMQARSHDAFLVNYLPKLNHSIHVGLAINANKESNFYEKYTVKNQYKNMQFLHYNAKLALLDFSILFLNQGITTNTAKVAYNQTSGVNLVYNLPLLKVEGSAYLQTGKIQENKLLASQFSVKATYKINEVLQIASGFEHLSGKGQNDVSLTYKSFNPWYGTNHKFNGFMDYFYVGNHLNNVGLNDINGQLNYANKKWKASLSPHYFASAKSPYFHTGELSKYLGTEIDLTASYQILSDLNINSGYSKIWIKDSMIHLKGGQENGNQWFFLALHCNPEIFRSTR